MKNLICAAAIGTWLLTSAALTHDEDSIVRADGHASNGVMSDHIYNAGEFMFSHRYMFNVIEGKKAYDQLSVCSDMDGAGEAHCHSRRTLCKGL